MSGDEYAHFRKVLRGHEGDVVMAADGAGMMRRVRIDAMSNDRADCTIIEELPSFEEPARPIHLVQAVLKNHAKLDWIVEKAVELGVASITFALTDRTISHTLRPDRLRSIALAAMKQCGRCVRPDILGPLPLKESLEPHGGLTIMCHEDPAGSKPLHELLGHDENRRRPVRLLIGPEGGFDGTEVAAALESGAALAWLGARRLRSETAAIVALAQCSIWE
jgi:16S rRNA (uracil1498-N3)-methyltransferase